MKHKGKFTMTPTEIKAELNQRGYSIALLAEVLNKTPVAVGAVINRKLVAKPTAESISKAIGKDVSEVFPDVPSYHTPCRAATREQKKIELQKQLSA
ncbi:hypothetical protein KUL49_30770 [Alteromonas sp. KUL49]|nr:hypothetical protein EYS00_15200 [Alteromonas sp. KUL49]GEA12702.1 hypothetical protein KUL49_30770 [Alteromonas sp. KUL49]